MKPRSAEEVRLEEDRLRQAAWKRWGPYVSDRSWGTVREDYSPNGDAWGCLPHDHARSKAYRWGEDGIAGFCDRYQLLVFALALWNGRDPILKERLFGLTPGETNHGEDVKEYYFHLDSTPTHSYMKFLYKYPQAEYPYGKLIEGSRARTDAESEYELLDTGVFDEGRYFDVFVEYAKAGPEDLCIRIEVCNRGPDEAPIHVLPHLWFRNTWSWGPQPSAAPVVRAGPSGPGGVQLVADDSGAEPLRNLLTPYSLGARYLHADPGGRLLFTDNETNRERLYGPSVTNGSPYVKDAFHRHVIGGEDCVNPAQTGTKACVHYANVVVPAGGSAVFRLRLTDQAMTDPLAGVDAVATRRREEADAFYADLQPPGATEDERRVQRQALAGMLWSKQTYLFDVNAWLEGDDPAWPPPESRKGLRNAHWRHLNSMRVMSLPDKWEYPWFAAWDLAFQCIPLALVDPDFAKEQLWLLLFEQFMHVNGQVPAYEWEFSDLNPPVHAWAVWRVYEMERRRTGRGDRTFLEKCFHKLLINFAWWVNRVDAEGHNVFEGGFLGLDNITVVDRSQKMPPGMTLKQSDATGWMGMFCLNLMRIAMELARERGLPGLGDQVLRALRLHRGGDAAHGPARFRAVERARGLLLRRTPLSRRLVSQVPFAVAGGVDPAVRGGMADGRTTGAVPRVPGQRGMVPAQPRPLHARVRPDDGVGRQKGLPAVADERIADAPSADATVGPGRVPQPARPAQPVQVPPGEPLSVHGERSPL